MRRTRRGFSLIEVLVVMGILAVLIAASIGGYSAVQKSAERAAAADLVAQVASALKTLHAQNEGRWPLRMAMVGETGGELDPDVAYQFVSGRVKYLSLAASGGKLIGYDRFGILDPWGTKKIKQLGESATLGAVQDHRLWFAVDTDGDGIISGANVGGESVDVRATAIVWCAGRDGKMETYSKGRRGDDVYSWTEGQTKNVK